MNCEAQDVFINETFRNMTNEDVGLVAEKVNELVDKGILEEDDFIDIRSVVVWRSIKGFYDLETSPREELWKVLKQMFGGDGK